MVLPWEGTYGFRSRIIEMMALGLPIITTEQAIDGMNLSEVDGLLLARGDADYSSHILSLLNDYELNKEMGMKGRIRVNTIYNKEQSYDPLVKIINRLNIN